MKRNILKYSFWAALCFTLQSCLFSEDDVFAESSAQRAMASVKFCQELLCSASNGWLLEYYPGKGPQYGGFNFIAKFDGENVEMASEVVTDNYAIGEVCTSLYTVQAGQSTELSFDSYNELIHALCIPFGYNDPGYAGDYEFTFIEMTPERIVLKGKKHGNMLVMNQMPIGKNWKEYLTNVLKIQSSCPYASFKFSKGNVENGQSIYLEGHNLKMYSKDDQGERVVTRYPFIYTETGIKMFSPITIDGVILDELDWDVKQRCFTAANGSNDYAISFYCPPAYKLYPGMYYLVSGTDQFVVSVSSKIEGSTYTLESEDFPPGTVLEAKFNVDTDCFDIEYQYACQYDNYQVYLCPWDSEAGYFTWSLGSGLSGTNVAKEGEMPLIEFTDNGVYGSADSFLFYAFSGTPSSSTAAGTIFRLVQPVLARVF